MRERKWLSYRTLRFMVTLILLFSVCGTLMYGIRYGFTVDRIEFLGSGMNAEINDRLITGNIIFFPSEKLRRDLLKEYPQLKDVIITKKFPHTITIMPILRQPFALLVTAKSAYGIDREGRVIEIADAGLPVAELRIDMPSVRVGTTIEDPRVQSSLLFLEKSKPILPVSVIQTSEDGLSMSAKSDATDILFTQSQNIETVMATLQTIINGVRIKGTMPKIIDLRFTKPVIQW